MNRMNNNDIDYESSDDGDSVPPPPSQTHHTSNYENLNDETDSLNDILSNNRDFRNNNNMSNNMINDTNDDYAFQNANTTSDLSNLLLSPNNNNNNNDKDIHHLTNPQLYVHHAQEYDEEAAANEEIEVRGSSIVVTMSRREKERGMENFDEDLNKDDGAGIAHVCSRRKRNRCLLMTVAGCAVAALITGIVTTVKPRATVINRLEDVPFTGTDAKGRFASNQGHKSRNIQEDPESMINQEEPFTGKRTNRMYPGSSQRSNGYNPTSDDSNKTRGSSEIARKRSERKIRKIGHDMRSGDDSEIQKGAFILDTP